MDFILAYTGLRVALGLNILMHGWVRLGSAHSGFIEATLPLFRSTRLPAGLVSAFLSVLPWAELLIGFGITLGLRTRTSLLSGFLTLLSLLFGMCLTQKWEIVSAQMIYALFYGVLIAALQYNLWSVDVFLTRSKRET